MRRQGAKQSRPSNYARTCPTSPVVQTVLVGQTIGFYRVRLVRSPGLAHPPAAPSVPHGIPAAKQPEARPQCRRTLPGDLSLVLVPHGIRRICPGASPPVPLHRKSTRHIPTARIGCVPPRTSSRCSYKISQSSSHL